jgi:hypothetical protein
MAIASCLVDTNILLRMTRRSDPQHQIVDTALARLASQGIILHHTRQNMAERAIESGMSFLPDSEAVIASGAGLSYSTVRWVFRCTMRPRPFSHYGP